MESYLKTDYDVFEDKNWLTSEEDIESYFIDNGYDLFNNIFFSYVKFYFILITT